MQDESAFPNQPCGADGLPEIEASPGMTLRDYFAAKAMVPILKLLLSGKLTPNPGESTSAEKLTAKQAYAVADAMLEARAEGREI